MCFGFLDRYRGCLGSELPEQVKENGQEGSGKQSGKGGKETGKQGF